MSSNIIYTHKHHIIPRHLRGTCPLLVLIINDKSNLIELTVPEHAEAHRLLYEKFGNEYDRIAWQGLLGCIGKEEIHRLSQIENGKKTGKKNKGIKKPPRTEEHKKKMSLANKGRKHSEESKRNMSLALTGRKFTEDHKRNISLAAKGKKMPPMTEEHKKNLSLAGKGRKVTEETRKKQSLANKGKKLTEDHKKKMSLAHLSRQKSPCPRCGMLLAANNMTRHLRKKVPCMASNDSPEAFRGSVCCYI